MSNRRHRAKAKTVQQMTRDGLVQQNLSTGETKNISSRQAEQEFHYSGATQTELRPAQEVAPQPHTPRHSSGKGADFSAIHRQETAPAATTPIAEASAISPIPTTDADASLHYYNVETPSDTGSGQAYHADPTGQRLEQHPQNTPVETDPVQSTVSHDVDSSRRNQRLSQQYQEAAASPGAETPPAYEPASYQPAPYAPVSNTSGQQEYYGNLAQSGTNPNDPYGYGQDIYQPSPVAPNHTTFQDVGQASLPQQNRFASYATSVAEQHVHRSHYRQDNKTSTYQEQHSQPTETTREAYSNRQDSATPNADNGIETLHRRNFTSETDSSRNEQFSAQGEQSFTAHRETEYQMPRQEAQPAASTSKHSYAPTRQPSAGEASQPSVTVTPSRVSTENRLTSEPVAAYSPVRSAGHAASVSEGSRPSAIQFERSETPITPIPSANRPVQATPVASTTDNGVEVLHRKAAAPVTDSGHSLQFSAKGEQQFIAPSQLESAPVSDRSAVLLQYRIALSEQTSRKAESSVHSVSTPQVKAETQATGTHPQGKRAGKSDAAKAQQVAKPAHDPTIAPLQETAKTSTGVSKPQKTAQSKQVPEQRQTGNQIQKPRTIQDAGKASPPQEAPSAPKDNGIDLNHRQEKVAPPKGTGDVRYSAKMKADVKAEKPVAQDLVQRKRQQLLRNQEGTDGAPAAAAATGKAAEKQASPKGTGNAGSAKAKSTKAAGDAAVRSSGQAAKKPAASQEIASRGKADRTHAQSKQAAKKKSVADNAASSQKKKKSKLQFDTEDATGKPGMVGTVKSAGKKTAAAAVGAAGAAIHSQIHEAEQDNVALDATHHAEIFAERGVRHADRLRTSSKMKHTQPKKASRLQQSASEAQKAFHTGQAAHQAKESASKTHLLNRLFQKQRNKRRAAEAAKAAKEGAKATGTAAAGTATLVEKTAKTVKEFFVSHKKTIYVLIGVILMLLFMITQLQSCSTIAIQTLGTVTASSWPAADSEITKAENYYTQLEANLQKKIDTVESRKSGCDEYSYNLDEIGHDPVVLISYLCAKYGNFTFNSTIEDELDALFALQYSYSESVSTETRTTTKTVRVGESLGEVVTSGYCNCSICCGIWAGGATASGAYPQANHTIAVDASNPIVPIGTVVVMNGIEYTVEDTGNFAQYGVDFDVYYDSHSAASAHGHQTWTAYLADSNGDTEVEVTTTETVKVCYVTLSTTSMETLVSSRMDTDQTELYTVYVSTRGNRQFLGTPVDYNWHYYVSSYYGYRVSTSGSIEMHNGLDISVPAGTEILSVIDGTVTTASYSSSYGKYIIIENDDGYWTLFAHCQSISVSAGDEVTTGDTIGTVGSTGNTTGTHLHIEFKYEDEYYNPYFYLAEGEGTLYGSAEYSSDAAALLVAEATKYLGTPYVWGGYSPSGFDCSGFVSYSINNCGAGWSVGRLTANGLLGICTTISASEAKAGDLIFFQGTYDTSGASHVGIYLGDGTMIHAGDPVKISSISTSYWQSHLLCYGRLPSP